MNKISRIKLLNIFILSLTFLVAGCLKKEKVNLTFMVNFQLNEKITEIMEEVINEFNALDKNIHVEFIPGSPEYEEILEVKMLVNDLPDMWATHGWSVDRYSDYLMPLENEKWASDIDEAIKPLISDSIGHIYGLPLDIDIAGIVYNKSVIEEAGIDIDKIKTWPDFFDAMAKVKEIGKIPVFIGGKDNWTIGNFFDWVAPSYYITDGFNSQAADLKAGVFKKGLWTDVAAMLKNMQDKDYLNADILSAKWSAVSEVLASGETAFAFMGNHVALDAFKINPEVELGFFPIPSFYEDDEPSLIIGERATIGIWKDTKYPKEVKRFFEYLASPPVMSRIASANGVPAGLSSVESDLGKLTMDYQKWSDIRRFPYFDREYLPNGMWNVMCSIGNGVLTGDMTPKDAADKMEEQFNLLYRR